MCIRDRFSDVPVDMLNEQVLDELNQTYKIESGDTVSFTVKGKKDIVDRLTKSDFRATADVSSMSDVHAIQMCIRDRTVRSLRWMRTQTFPRSDQHLAETLWHIS